ncbi:MAG: ACT domain-containing protein [Actinomycetota bacterium]|nr:ACT domain-containing protein [Actinomycetota bacterium]
MSVEGDLAALLGNMRPRLLDGSFVFVTVDGWAGAEGLDARASVHEDEGLSVVVDRLEADRRQLSYDYVAAWITLEVRSALGAVGLTAAVSRTLADAGISCNVIAGRHHDHLLVPAERVAEAMITLQALSGG